MSLLQKKLRSDLPYGKVFQGSGEQNPADRDVKFYQHGLYFDAKGDLAVDSPHNAAKIALFKKLGSNPEEPEQQVQKEEKPVVNPEVIAALGSYDDDKIYQVAMNLVKVKTEQSEEYGEYVPSVDKREDNIDFIAQYTV